MERRAPESAARLSSPLPLAGGVGGGPDSQDPAQERHPTLRARQLRTDATPAERHLWRRLSARQVIGARFNRQARIGPFYADFVCRAVKLVVEVDGGQHASRIEEDARRTRYLEANGYRVIRFWNNDVLENVEGVIEAIAAALKASPSPDPSRKREGSRDAPSTSNLASRSREEPSSDHLPCRSREELGKGLSTRPGRDQ